MNTYFAGLDLGQSQDYTALAIAERIVPFEGKASYDFRYLERLKLGTPYPDQVTHVKEILEQPQLKGKVTLALDYYRRWATCCGYVQGRSHSVRSLHGGHPWRR